MKLQKFDISISPRLCRTFNVLRHKNISYLVLLFRNHYLISNIVWKQPNLTENFPNNNYPMFYFQIKNSGKPFLTFQPKLIQQNKRTSQRWTADSNKSNSFSWNEVVTLRQTSAMELNSSEVFATPFSSFFLRIPALGLSILFEKSIGKYTKPSYIKKISLYLLKD